MLPPTLIQAPVKQEISQSAVLTAYTAFWLSNDCSPIAASQRNAMMRQNATTAPMMLNSWKEIAAYLGRGVRTVQRWERDLGLPVHRIGKGKRSPVYATVTDLNFWISTTEAVRAPKLQPHLVQRTQRNNAKPIEDSRRLLSDARR